MKSRDQAHPPSSTPDFGDHTLIVGKKPVNISYLCASTVKALNAALGEGTVSK